MYYITVRQPPRYHQMTLEELLFGSDNKCYNYNTEIAPSDSNTRTICVNSISDYMSQRFNVKKLIFQLKKFNATTAHLHDMPRSELYDTFYIPKKSGGLRRIDAPKTELMNALRELKLIFEVDFRALYHTSAFAYIKHRSTVDCMRRHQNNESKWFAKFDLTNFFNNTTKAYVMHVLSSIFPFCEVIKDHEGKEQLEIALDLAFLNGGLPQGTPISPMLTNLIMIPIDHSISNTLRKYNNQHFVYTRYADDFQISSRYNFDFREIEDLIVSTLHKFQAPFWLNTKKTRYGSSSGSNWNLGVMINKDGQMTVGHKKKKQFQNMLFSYIRDSKNGIKWDKHDIMIMDGYRNYYKMVEGETIDRIVAHINKKENVNVVEMMKEDLKREQKS